MSPLGGVLSSKSSATTNRWHREHIRSKGQNVSLKKFLFVQAVSKALIAAVGYLAKNYKQPKYPFDSRRPTTP